MLAGYDQAGLLTSGF